MFNYTGTAIRVTMAFETNFSFSSAMEKTSDSATITLRPRLITFALQRIELPIAGLKYLALFNLPIKIISL